MTYTAYAGDGTIVEQGPFDTQCGPGEDIDAFDLAVNHAPVTRLVVTPPVPIPPDYYGPGVAVLLLLEYNVPCPTTGDSVLDNASVRHSLNNEWNLSKSEGKERGGWIYRNDTDGDYLVWFDLNAAPRDICHDNFTPVPPPMSGYTGVYIWHTHIVLPGTKFGLLGSACSDFPSELTVANGPSPFDRAKTEQAHKRHIIIDDNELFIQYRLDEGGGTLSWAWIENCRAL